MTAALQFEVVDDDLGDIEGGREVDWAEVRKIIAERRVAALGGLIDHRRNAGTYGGASAQAAVETAATLIAYLAVLAKDTPRKALREMRRFAVAAGCTPGKDLSAMLVRVLDEAAYVSARDAGRTVDLTETEWVRWRVSYIYPVVSEARLEELLAERERARLKARDAERNLKRRKQDRQSYVNNSATRIAEGMGIARKTLYRRMEKAGFTDPVAYRDHVQANDTGTPPLNIHRRDQPVTPPVPFRFDTPSALSEARRRASVNRLLGAAISAFSNPPARPARPLRGAR